MSRRPRGPRGGRVRDAAPAAAHRARQPRRRRALPHVPLPDVRARHLPVPPARATGAASVTHLMDDPIVPDAAALAAARDAGLPYFRGGIVEHGGGRAPGAWRRSTPRRVATHARGDARVADARPAWPRSRCRARTCPQATNRIDLDPQRDATCSGFPAGRVTYSPHRHEIACAEHWAPRLEAVMREAGAEHTFWATSPPLPGSFGDQPGSRAPMSRHIMGTRPHGRRPAHERVRPVAAAARGRERASAPTRRCSRRRPATARRSRSSRSRSAPSRALAGLEPLRSTRPGARAVGAAASCRRCP